jgi:hypothetical protein
LFDNQNEKIVAMNIEDVDRIIASLRESGAKNYDLDENKGIVP